MIQKVVFPVAGLGTRFLPATKASPKEMLPIVDKPLIQYAVEEAIAAGAKQLIFVTSYLKRSIEDHFDSNFELNVKLKEKNKAHLLKVVENILPDDVQCVYIRQKEALGLGHAIYCAKDVIGDTSFGVILADDLIMENTAVSSSQLSDMPEGRHYGLGQLAEIHKKTGSSVIAAEEVLREQVDQYGILKMNAQNQLIEIVEKPAIEQAPSNLAVIGRYIFTPQIFDCIHMHERGVGDEIQITDAIDRLMKIQRVYGETLKNKRFDCGNKFGYFKANIEFYMSDPLLKEEALKYLKNYVDILSKN